MKFLTFLAFPAFALGAFLVWIICLLAMLSFCELTGLKVYQATRPGAIYQVNFLLK